MPNLCAWTRNVSGSTDARLVPGASLPFGPVTPHATCSSGSGPRYGEWMPASTALQMRAYWYALSTRHLPATRLYCGVSQIGLFGSFHAVQSFTFGSGSADVGLLGSCCHFGAVQRPL